MGIFLKEWVSFSELTTFLVGGRARYFCEAKNIKELLAALDYAQKNNLSFLILGGGSNVLFSDNDFLGLVIKIQFLGIEFLEDQETCLVEVGAGMVWDDLVEKTLQKNLSGLENLSGIPGLVGASPIQNIGAYGAEVKDFLVDLRALSLVNREIKVFNKQDLNFSYRNSLLKELKDQYIVLSVKFRLHKEIKLNKNYQDILNFEKEFGQILTPKQMRQAILQIRNKKFPDPRLYGSAGSFFENPILPVKSVEHLLEKYIALPVFDTEKDGFKKISAAYLIDKVCHLKGLKVGEAFVFQNQALVIATTKKSLARDVFVLSEKIIQQVFEKTGVLLKREVNLIGEW